MVRERSLSDEGRLFALQAKAATPDPLETLDRRVAKETLVLLACPVDAVCEALEDFQVPLARQDDPASEVPPALTANLATKDPRAFRVSQALWECQEHKDRS